MIFKLNWLKFFKLVYQSYLFIFTDVIPQSSWMPVIVDWYKKIIEVRIVRDVSIVLAVTSLCLACVLLIIIIIPKALNAGNLLFSEVLNFI